MAAERAEPQDQGRGALPFRDSEVPGPVGGGGFCGEPPRRVVWVLPFDVLPAGSSGPDDGDPRPASPECGDLGGEPLRPHGDARPARSVDPCHGHGRDQQQAVGVRDGHPEPADPVDPGGEDQERLVGEVAAHRARSGARGDCIIQRHAAVDGVRRWRRARWLHMKAARGKNTVNEMVELFFGWILEAGGPLGRVLSRGLASARRRQACEATGAVFPLPMLPPLGHPKYFRSKGLASAGRAWVNVITAALNLFHAGSEEGAVCSSSPTAAHSRIHEQLCESLSGFLGEVSDWPSDSEIRELLRLSEGYLPSSGAALLLGELGGVPPSTYSRGFSFRCTQEILS